LLRTPYSWGTDSFVQAYETAYAKRFAERGYAFVMQECRGTGRSEGVFYPFRNEYGDGKDTVQWLAAQDWVDGKIGTIGPSYKGFTALAAAAAAGDLVSAVVADGAPGDFYRGWPREQGGAVDIGTMSFLYLMDHGDFPTELSLFETYSAYTPLVDADQAVLGHDSPYWNDFVAAYDDPTQQFWTQTSLSSRFEDICSPVLHIKAHEEMWTGPRLNYIGIQSAGCDGAGNDQQWFVFGSATHGGLSNGTDGPECEPAMELMYDFLDHYLKDGNTVELPEQRFWLRLAGTTDWHSVTDWPPFTTAQEFFLVPNGGGSKYGALSTVAPSLATTLSYQFDPATADPCSSSYGDYVYFESSNLAEPLDVVGVPRLRLFIKTTAIETDFVGVLFAVDPVSMEYDFVEQGTVRTRFLGVDGAPSGPIVPNTVYELSMEFPALSHRIAAGHRFGVRIASAKCGVNMNHNTGGPIATDTTTVAATQQVLFGPQHPTALIWPTFAAVSR